MLDGHLNALVDATKACGCPASRFPDIYEFTKTGIKKARLGASSRIGSRQRPRKRCSAWLEAGAIQQTKPQCDRDDSLRSYQKAYPHTSAQVPPLWAQLQILTAEIEYSTEAMWIWEKWHLLFSQSSEFRKITEDPEWGTACQLVCSCLAPLPEISSKMFASYSTLQPTGMQNIFTCNIERKGPWMSSNEISANVLLGAHDQGLG